MSPDYQSQIKEILRRDPRYAAPAYDFIFECLQFTVHRRKEDREATTEERHVSGSEILEGTRIYASDQFGYLARTVLSSWGVRNCEDIGEIVFNLVDAELMRKTDEDRREHFENGFDFEDVFETEFQVDLRDTEFHRR